MRTRIAIGIVLALGVVAALPAASMAQISDSGQAAQAQYPDITPPPPAAEERSDDSKLPFTGYVAIPLLLTGAGLLITGTVMHMRTRREE